MKKDKMAYIRNLLVQKMEDLPSQLIMQYSNSK